MVTVQGPASTTVTGTRRPSERNRLGHADLLAENCLFHGLHLFRLLARAQPALVLDRSLRYLPYDKTDVLPGFNQGPGHQDAPFAARPMLCFCQSSRWLDLDLNARRKVQLGRAPRSAGGSMMSIRRLWVRISNCSRESLCLWGERRMVTISFSVGNGIGPGCWRGCASRCPRCGRALVDHGVLMGELVADLLVSRCLSSC